MLQANFENVPSGLRKIRNGEFVIQDAASGRTIDLSKAWETCFAPGQRVDMRMIFQRTTRQRNACPSCRTWHRIQRGADVQCLRCGLTFRRVVQIHDAPDAPSNESTKVVVRHLALVTSGTSTATSSTSSSGPLPPETAFDESEDVSFYRRIQVAERRRRTAWRDQGDAAPRPPAETRDLNTHDADRAKQLNEVAYQGEEVASTTNNADIHEILHGVINLDCFNQILEMDDDDDDDDDREFSRTLTFSNLASINQGFERIKSALYVASSIPSVNQDRTVTSTEQYPRPVLFLAALISTLLGFLTSHSNSYIG